MYGGSSAQLDKTFLVIGGRWKKNGMSTVFTTSMMFNPETGAFETRIEKMEIGVYYAATIGEYTV